jgi:hypothetical protein
VTCPFPSIHLFDSKGVFQAATDIELAGMSARETAVYAGLKEAAVSCQEAEAELGAATKAQTAATRELNEAKRLLAAQPVLTQADLMRQVWAANRARAS